jgi:hypothetical protein
MRPRFLPTLPAWCLDTLATWFQDFCLTRFHEIEGQTFPGLSIFGHQGTISPMFQGAHRIRITRNAMVARPPWRLDHLEPELP